MVPMLALFSLTFLLYRGENLRLKVKVTGT